MSTCSEHRFGPILRLFDSMRFPLAPSSRSLIMSSSPASKTIASCSGKNGLQTQSRPFFEISCLRTRQPGDGNVPPPLPKFECIEIHQFTDFWGSARRPLKKPMSGRAFLATRFGSPPGRTTPALKKQGHDRSRALVISSECKSLVSKAFSEAPINDRHCRPLQRPDLAELQRS